MDRNFRKEAGVEGAGASPPSEAWLFAQALLGKPVPSPCVAEADARAEREHLAWLASISPQHERQLRSLLSKEAEARAQRELLEWLATISPRHESQLRSLLVSEAQVRDAQERMQWLAEGSHAQEAQWDPSKHPHGAFPQNRGWWSPTGGAGGSGGGKQSPSFFDAVIRRNQAVADLTGGTTPGMARSSRLAADIESAVRLPGEVASAAAAGLGTGGRALVNASATAIKNVATLGLSTSQLELIGVTQEDRDRGYDTAVTIATASGEVLIAVGTGGITSALSKGGSIAKTASGALIAYDAAGNAVGVVQGTYDASQNRINLSNGAQVAAGVLGLGANVNAARALKSPVSLGKRVGEIHETLHPIARVQRTTAILETSSGTRIVASGGRDLTPAQRALLGPRDVAARLAGAHAELTALEHAAQNGFVPTQLTASRPFCQECIEAIEAAGGIITSPTTAIFPR